MFTKFTPYIPEKEDEIKIDEWIDQIWQSLDDLGIKKWNPTGTVPSSISYQFWGINIDRYIKGYIEVSKIDKK